jgi:aconitate hydratase
VPKAGEIDYSHVVKLDLGKVAPSLAGPKRPQDRIEIGHVAGQFDELFSAPVAQNGFNLPADQLARRHVVSPDGPEALQPESKPLSAGAERNKAEMVSNTPETGKVEASAIAADASHAVAAPEKSFDIGSGDVLIAAITSCTNTSNPSVMLAAGLLAKKAVQAGLKVKPHIKTSLAPGSRLVTRYLTEAGLLPYLEKLGFALAGYGCTTCIGNAGDLTPRSTPSSRRTIWSARPCSGNRNFEARIHPNIKANFLASPPLVVAYAIAGTVRKDLMTEPVGKGKGGKDVYLGDIWPSSEEIQELLKFAMNGKAFRSNYEQVASEPGKLWEKIGRDGRHLHLAREHLHRRAAVLCRLCSGAESAVRRRQSLQSARVHGARIMALFGDSITTDHISPAGSIKESSPAGKWLLEHGVQKPTSTAMARAGATTR